MNITKNYLQYKVINILNTCIYYLLIQIQFTLYSLPKKVTLIYL